MTKPYPKEFHDDVMAVARRRDPDIALKQISVDFGISESCSNNWLSRADRDEGVRTGPPTDELSETRALRRRICLLEQENEVLGRAAAYLS